MNGKGYGKGYGGGYGDGYGGGWGPAPGGGCCKGSHRYTPYDDNHYGCQGGYGGYTPTVYKPQETPYDDDPEKEELVSRVKAIQRSGDDEKQKWWDFCGLQNTGTRDPNRHGSKFLRSFLKAYDTGEVAKPSSARGPPPRRPTRSGGPAGGRAILRLRGLPFHCGPRAILDFFADFSIQESDMAFTMNREGRPTGEVYVSFICADDADYAMESKQNQNIGSRYVEIFKATMDEWDQATADREKDDFDDSAVYARKRGDAGHGSSDRDWSRKTSWPTLRLRGLPFTSTAADVVRFLHNFRIEESCVAFAYGSDNRPTGEAFVSFETEEEAGRVLDTMQNEKIGSRYIELFKSSYDEWTQAASYQIAPPMGGGGGGCRSKGGWVPPGPEFWPGPFGAYGGGYGGGYCGGPFHGPFGGDWWGPPMHKKGCGGTSYHARPSRRNDDDGDPAKAGLVERIKQIQRTSDEEKAKWWHFADTNGKGIRDPQRHDAPFLQQFLEEYDGLAEGEGESRYVEEAEAAYALEVEAGAEEVAEEYAEETEAYAEEYADRFLKLLKP